MLNDIVTVLTNTMKVKDPYTASHQRHVAQIAVAIAQEMSADPKFVEGVRVMGLLHDLGKIGIPGAILSKPSLLSQQEFELVKMHPQVGHNILVKIKWPWPVALVVLQHHERLDGSGYPHGFSGSEIVPEARILAVADVVEAMASHRPYRPALGLDKAIWEISGKQGVRYDPEVVGACLKILEETTIWRGNTLAEGNYSARAVL
jgi:HD-GYP domain-containing protein (c-di-GMP phosphodiesterase class II)